MYEICMEWATVAPSLSTVTANEAAAVERRIRAGGRGKRQPMHDRRTTKKSRHSSMPANCDMDHRVTCPTNFSLSATIYSSRSAAAEAKTFDSPFFPLPRACTCYIAVTCFRFANLRNSIGMNRYSLNLIRELFSD